MTKEAVTISRTVRRSGMSVRATSQPIGAATRQQITATEVARISVVTSGSTKVGSVNRVAKLPSVILRAGEDRRCAGVGRPGVRAGEHVAVEHHRGVVAQFARNFGDSAAGAQRALLGHVVDPLQEPVRGGLHLAHPPQRLDLPHQPLRPPGEQGMLAGEVAAIPVEQVSEQPRRLKIELQNIADRKLKVIAPTAYYYSKPAK